MVTQQLRIERQCHCYYHGHDRHERKHQHATQNAAKEAATKAVVTPTAAVDYNLERFRKFKRTIVNAARVASSII